MIRISSGTWRAGALALAALAALPAVLAQEAAVTRRATALREAPADAAASLAVLPQQSALTRLPQRHGPWVQVRTETGVTGWLHLFDLAPAAAAARTQGGSVGSVLRGVTGLLGGAAPAGSSTTAAGLRGLGAEDLAQAQPDPAAVTRMEALRQTEAQARAFAEAASLRPAAVEPLPAPAAAVGGGPAASEPAGQEAQ